MDNNSNDPEKGRESGQPGGGAGRRDEVGKSGVYRVSGPLPAGDAPIVGMASWGQGARGPSGYEDHGDSELFFRQVTPERCRDVMTKDPICCLSTDNIAAVAELMKAHDIGVLPVVDTQESKKLVGIVTDRDLVLRVLAASAGTAATPVRQILSAPAITCSPDDPYDRAIELMERHKVKRVAVTDNSGRVVGIISEADVALRIRDRNKTAEVVESICLPNPA